MQSYEELRRLGCGRGHDAVRRGAGTARQAQESGTAAAFAPLTLAPDEADPFD